MDQDSKELNLDAIVKEFTGPLPEIPQVEGQLEPELEEKVSTILNAEPLTPIFKDGPLDLSQTQRFLLDPANLAKTQRIDTRAVESALKEPKGLDGSTVRFRAVSEQPEPPIPEGAEPFSAGWEPEYDAPMGEYVPPEPIQFRPRSRLSELKQAIAEGPERRYYELAQQGLGKLQAAMFLSLLVVALACLSLWLHGAGLVQPDRMRLLVYGELFAMIFSALLACGRLMDGALSLLRKKFTPDSLLLASFLVCLADGVCCLREVRVPFCGAFCLAAAMSLWGEYERRNTEMGQMDTLRKATRLRRVDKAPGCLDGKPGFWVREGRVEDFMETYSETTGPEKVLNLYCLGAFLATLCIAVAVMATRGVSVGLQTWSAAILAALPVTGFICQSRPMAVLERRFHQLGVVLCGWRGTKTLSGSAVVPLKDTDLLPYGSVKINGIKYYSRLDQDEIVSCAAAVMEQAENALTPLFTYLRDSRNGRHYEVEDYTAYDHGCAGGIVDGKTVLIGPGSFLHRMGVRMPQGAKVNQAVYVAIDGELSAVFAMTFGKLRGVSAGLHTLTGVKKLKVALVGDNFVLSDTFLHNKFGLEPNRLHRPDEEQLRALESWQPDEEQSLPCALTTQDGLAPTAFAITGGRALRTARRVGAIVHIIAGVVGIAMVLALTLVRAHDLMTPQNLLAYHLVWLIPGLLITEWTRHI